MLLRNFFVPVYFRGQQCPQLRESRGPTLNLRSSGEQAHGYFFFISVRVPIELTKYLSVTFP